MFQKSGRPAFIGLVRADRIDNRRAARRGGSGTSPAVNVRCVTFKDRALMMAESSGVSAKSSSSLVTGRTPL